MGKIINIIVQQPKETTLPDGVYLGTWGGSIIELKLNGKIYELTTDEGVRGTGFKVVVTIKNGVATYEEINN